MLHKYTLGLLFLALLTGCSPKNSAPASAPKNAGLLELRETMTGTFNSSLQAQTDDSYYDISLVMTPIWEDRPGTWLYVEQALASTPDNPYRQRVYELEHLRGKRYASHVYELPEPENFIGAQDDRAKFRNLTPAQLTKREGCTVFLRREGPGLFRGSTKKNQCQSSLRGAAYATSRVSISKTFVQSWDQGFDAGGTQVWGATEGGYMFFKEN